MEYLDKISDPLKNCDEENTFGGLYGSGSVNETDCEITFHVDLSKHFYTDNSKDTLTIGGDYIKEGDYEHFNMAAMDCEQLIKDGVVTIHKLEFRRRTSHDTPPTEQSSADSNKGNEI